MDISSNISITSYNYHVLKTILELKSTCIQKFKLLKPYFIMDYQTNLKYQVFPSFYWSCIPYSTFPNHAL